MGYIYILMIWTVVGVGDAKGSPTVVKYDWRSLGEFHNSPDAGKNAQQMCQEAARQLALKAENYRCVRSK